MGLVIIIPPPAVHMRVLEIIDSKRMRVKCALYSGTSVCRAGYRLSTPAMKGGVAYAGVDWVAGMIYAKVDSDLLDLKNWHLTNRIGNPLSVHITAMSKVMGIAGRTDATVQRVVRGGKVKLLSDSDALENEIGSLYFMEATIAQNHNGTVLMYMRLNNMRQCNLGAVVKVVPRGQGQRGKSARGEVHGGGYNVKFDKYAFVPGLGVAHPAVLYDEESQLMWMVSNFNRNSHRDWSMLEKGVHEKVVVPPGSNCESDRSALGLYVSYSGYDWHFIKMLFVSPKLTEHMTYSALLLDGEDMLVVARGNAEESGAPRGNHDSKGIYFTRLKNFRGLVESHIYDWLRSR